MLFARGFILQEKKIVRERYVFAGPMRSALPPPPRQFLPFGLCVIVGQGLRGHVALRHCVAWFARLCALWVIVGHSLFITHNNTRTNFVHSVCGQCGQLWRALSIARRPAYIST
jgi:hypothetical protein